MFEEDMYVVIAFDEEDPKGALCMVTEGGKQIASKKECKRFVKTYKDDFPTVEYKLYKLKFKETI